MIKATESEGRHRTTVNLSTSLLRAAKEEIGSTSATEAITAALVEMVARRRRERLVHLDLPDLTPESVDAVRQSRPA